MAYLLNATKTPTACPAPIYGQNTPHFSHTVIIIIFFCLATSTSHRQARSCSLSCSMSLTCILTALPLKLKKITQRITNSSVTQCKSQFLITYREVKNCQVIDISNCSGITRMDVDHAILIFGCYDILIIKIARTLLRPLLLPNMYANTWAIIKYVLCFCTK